MFQPVGALDLLELEARVLARWADDDVFGESLRNRHGRPEWVFYEGPPTANGKPGIHHVWARLFKDIFPRFHTMRGKRVLRKGGWDCHGLPVEVQVEKELGFSVKHEIEDYGIERFNAKCRSSVQRYVEDWQSLTNRIGMWLDTAGAYWTLSNDYIESVWWLFHEMWDKGSIYEGYKVVPYCGRCGTALSSHELGQPGAYRDVTEPSVYVRFPLIERDFDLLVWTTTPWTLPSNVGAAIGPDVSYVRVRAPEGRDLVMARDRVEAVFGDDARRGRPGRRSTSSSARATSRRSHSSPSTESLRSVWWPTSSSPSTTARASCTSHPRSARSTARSPSARASPPSTRSTTRPASPTSRRALRRASS